MNENQTTLSIIIQNQLNIFALNTVQDRSSFRVALSLVSSLMKLNDEEQF